MGRKRTEPEHELGRPGGPGTDPDVLGLGVTVMRAPSGGGYVMPRALAKLRGSAADAAQELQTQALLRAEVEERIEHLVAHCRSEGLSWASIGWCIGTTAQSAQGRYGVDDRA